MPAAVLPARFLVNTKLEPKLHSIDSASSREEGAPRGRPFFTAFRLSKKPSCKEFKSSADDGIKCNSVISGDMRLGNDTSREVFADNVGYPENHENVFLGEEEQRRERPFALARMGVVRSL